MKLPIGLCSWSLSNDCNLIKQTMHDVGVSYLHLEALAIDDFRTMISENGWTVSCMMLAFPQEDYSTLESIRTTGGIVPDAAWDANRELAEKAIGIAAAESVGLLSFHAGFIDHTDAGTYATLCERIRALADAAQANGITLLLETGQETAADLRSFLEEMDHSALGVNFDPANMILYGKGDPIEAVKVLAPWIRHVHIKDAVASKVPGEWGAEVPWGDGEVGAERFMQALEEIEYSGALAIEREAGDARAEDIKLAVQRLGGK